MAERGLLGILIIILAVLLFAQPDLAWPVRSMFGWNAETTDVSRLREENIALRAESAVLHDRLGRIPSEFQSEKTASVFVSYPFNFKNQLLVSAGRNEDVREGDTVFLPDPSSSTKRGIFIGRVESVQEKTSVVQTVFDSRFQLGVRIGEEGIESLMTGGSRPKLTLIPKTAEIRPGDVVIAAASQLPYGLAIGEVKEIALASGGLLQEATVRFPYDITQVRTVLLAR
jgi:cell shape-determining protein MreC